LVSKESDQVAPADAFDALMDAAVDAIIIIDDKGTIKRFNRAAETLFGYSEQDVRGSNINLLMPEPHHSNHDAYLERYLETGQASIIGQGREVAGLKRGGDTFPMFLSVGEIKQPGSQHYVGIIKDLSEVRATQEQVRKLEEQLLHADRLVILGELTAGIAHEINQPLTAIAAYADAGRKIIERQTEQPGGDMNSICERIGEQSRRAAEVVQRLRKLVRSGTVSKARHDINQIIKSTLLLFEFEIKRSNTKLLFYPMDSLEDIYVDEIHIQQIMVNLVKNSIDAISLAGMTDGCIEIRVRKEDSELLVVVRDNGPGVPESLRDHLFESFFTTKPQGVGLGLSICKTIAGAHGGNLQYAQPDEGGSEFTLSLPLKLIG
jgi:two-component system sensor kinase FixL